MNLTQIYFFPLDEHGHEMDPIPVALNADQSADLSLLPEPVREHLRHFGVQDMLREHTLFPKDGPAFLEALLSISHGYWRFRSIPNKRA